jgi:putative peptide zinc metalloprotease protein
MAVGADLETDDASDVSSHEQFHDDSSQGGRNEVIVHNQSDGKLLMRGRVDLEHLPGRSVAPENYAEAVGSCVRCQTLAVALQIDLISRNATTIAPQNAAVALNLHCTGCFTSARALQYVIQVDDPTEVPERATELVQTMNRELRSVQHSRHITVTEAQSKIDAVVAQFRDLAVNLREERRDTEDESNGLVPWVSPA